MDFLHDQLGNRSQAAGADHRRYFLTLLAATGATFHLPRHRCRGGAGKGQPVNRPNFAPESASNFGSDTFLMKFRIRVELISRESAPCNIQCSAPALCRRGLLWRVRIAIFKRPFSRSALLGTPACARRAEWIQAGP